MPMMPMMSMMSMMPMMPSMPHRCRVINQNLLAYFFGQFIWTKLINSSLVIALLILGTAFTNVCLKEMLYWETDEKLKVILKHLSYTMAAPAYE